MRSRSLVMHDLLWSFMHIAIYDKAAGLTAAKRLRPSPVLVKLGSGKDALLLSFGLNALLREQSLRLARWAYLLDGRQPSRWTVTAGSLNRIRLNRLVLPFCKPSE